MVIKELQDRIWQFFVDQVNFKGNFEKFLEDIRPDELHSGRNVMPVSNCFSICMTPKCF